MAENVVEIIESEEVVTMGNADGTGKVAKKKKKNLKYLRNFLIKLLFIAVVILVLLTFAFGIKVYHGNEMYPAIRDGDLLLTYKLESYNIGDVVVYETEDGVEHISRIVAVGSNVVNMTEVGELLVNDFVPSESIYYPTFKDVEGTTIEYPYLVPEGEFFLLDDYRTLGEDSRVYGSIPLSQLKGKVIYVLRRRGI